jgi:hypothetical protein
MLKGTISRAKENRNEASSKSDRLHRFPVSRWKMPMADGAREAKALR